MKLSSSQRWATGAIVLAALIACSPQAEPPQPQPQPPVATAPPVPVPAPAISEAPAVEPGYAGAWAFADAECGDAAKTLHLSGQSITMAPGENACAVKSIGEEHPTGRSMIYHIKADCAGGDGVTEDTFTLSFGASDTFMRMQANARPPVSLMRCPEPETP